MTTRKGRKRRSNRSNQPEWKEIYSGLSLIICFLFYVVGSLAAYGIDISLAQCEDGVTQAQWNSIVSQGHSFAIIEAWDGGFTYNSKIAQCVSNAWSGGMKHVDVYAFLCPNCQGNNPPTDAIERLVNNLRSQNVRFGTLWFDVEQCQGCWNDVSSNAGFLYSAVQKATSMGITVGIYSSSYEWGQTVGSYSGLNKFPLWYAHYDGEPNFSDSSAYSFGGWSHPSMKQFADYCGNCDGVNADSNWYPDNLFDNITIIH